jgi:uncharacterized protein (TIGR00290 family)
MPKEKVVVSWSGGKDCMIAIHELMFKKVVEVNYLLSVIDAQTQKVTMHGLDVRLLIKQAEAINLPIEVLKMPEMPSNEVYKQLLSEKYEAFKQEGIHEVVYGDLFLEDLRLYREKQLQEFGLKAIFPLWKRDTSQLIEEFIALGYKAIVICTQAHLKDFCGRIIDRQFLAELPKDVDPCGENGEFHTFVFDGPLFARPIQFEIGTPYKKSYVSPSKNEEEIAFWYSNLIIK